MSIVRVVYRKWPSSAHYSYEATHLGEDEHGVWMRCDEGSQVYKGDRPAFIRPYGLLSLVPRQQAWWSALWYPPTEDEFELYVDVNTPPDWEGSVAVEMVDLDLDVESRRDGTVEIVDRDEFETNMGSLGYPADIVAAAEQAATDVVAMIERRAEPFGAAWEPWYRACFDL